MYHEDSNKLEFIPNEYPASGKLRSTLLNKNTEYFKELSNLNVIPHDYLAPKAYKEQFDKNFLGYGHESKEQLSPTAFYLGQLALKTEVELVPIDPLTDSAWRFGAFGEPTPIYDGILADLATPIYASLVVDYDQPSRA